MKKITALLITLLLLFSTLPVNAAAYNQVSASKSPVYTISQRFRSDWFRQWLKERRERIEKPVEPPVVEPSVVEPPVVEPPVVEPPVVEPPVVEPPVEDQGESVLTYGAKGDGLSDDTAAIQAALNTGKNIFIPDGTYLINVDQTIKPQSGQTLQLSENAILKALPSANGYHAVIRLASVNNVQISGGKIIGERYDHQGNSGEWGMGIQVMEGSSQINISDVTISDCWGDGVYVGDPVTVTDVVVDNVICDNNRRQGISITNAKGIVVKNSVFKNTNGTLPAAGIDIEPNPGQSTEDVEITNVRSEGNAGSGIDLMGCFGTIKNVRISGCDLVNNQGMGVKLVNSSDISLNDSRISGNFYGIDIQRDVYNAVFSNLTVSRNEQRGLSLITSGQNTGVEKITFEKVMFSNNSQGQAGSSDGVRIDAWDSTGYIKDVNFKACHFIDDQVAKTQRYGMTVGFNDKVSGISYDSASIFSGNISGDLIADSLILHRI